MDQQWHHLHKRLKRYLGRFLKRPEDAEDIAQEACLRVLEAASKGEIRYQQAYLFRTAHNLALSSLALKSNQIVDSMEEITDQDALAESGMLEDQVADQRRFELFCRATTELPEQCRQVLVLRKVYGYSQQEVALRLGITVSTVDKHLVKGLVRCHLYMKEQESPIPGDRKVVATGHQAKARRRQS